MGRARNSSQTTRKVSTEGIAKYAIVLYYLSHMTDTYGEIHAALTVVPPVEEIGAYATANSDDVVIQEIAYMGGSAVEADLQDVRFFLGLARRLKEQA